MKHAVRSLKYFISLCVICAALMSLMLLTGTSAMSLDDTLYAMLHTDRYLVLYGSIVVLSLFYPKFGFVKRYLSGDISADGEKIVNAFRSEGFSLVGEKDGVMTFRGGHFFKRLMLLFEDEITVRQEDDQIVIEGIRRAVARVHYRLEAYIQQRDNE